MYCPIRSSIDSSGLYNQRWFRFNFGGALLCATLTLLFCFPSVIRAQSPFDGFNPFANSRVSTIAVQSDGKILVGGGFTDIDGHTLNRIARLNGDGTVDTSFNPNANDAVFAIAVQSDGKILVGGIFTSIGGQPLNHIARLNTNGTVDTSFNPNANRLILTVAVQPDGKILVGGVFTSIVGQARGRIARLNADGTLDMSFDQNANDDVYTLALQADGKILLGGTFTSIDGQTHNHIARLNADGTLDTSFNSNAGNSVLAIAVQADGKILVGGHIARLNADGTLDTSFNPNVDSVLAIAVQTDGKILVGGGFTSIDGQTRNRIARLNTDGTLEPSFNPNANGQVDTITVQADGKILMGGLFTSVGLPVQSHIARLNADGSLDTALNPNANNYINAISLQTDGQILLGGAFTTIGAQNRNRIARLYADNTLDVFNPNPNNVVEPIAVQADGKILVGGEFTSLSPNGGAAVTRNYIARLNADGTLDTLFNPNALNSVYAITVQPDGKILVGGNFTGIGGQTRYYIARLNADGTLDTSFNPNPNGAVFAIAVQSDGKILTGGYFNGTNSIGGQTRNYIARLNIDGTVDTSFNPNANNSIKVIALQPDGKILAGGQFTSLSPNGGTAVTRNHIARLNADGTLDTSFNPNADNVVYTIALQADGKILVGGEFTSIGGLYSYMARLNANGTLDPSFVPNANSWVYAIAVEADGKILVGQFTAFSSVPRNRIARLTNNTAALQDLSVTQTSTTWTRSGASPELWRVTFEQSTDGVNYTFLGNAARVGTTSNFTLTGLSLPAGQNIYVRARGFYHGGIYNGSESVSESVRQVFLPKANQTITFGALANKTFGDADFTVSATASSGLSVSFAASGQCTVASNTVHITGAGSCTITASQAGDSNYNAAPNVQQSFNIAKAGQTINVNTHAPTTATYNSQFTVAATASSGLPVAYSSAGACTNSGATFTITSSTGTCTVKYDQAGDANYNAAPQVTESVTITQSNLVQFSASNYNVQEDCTTVTVTVNRVGDTSAAASVDYSTSDVTASERRDYVTALGKLQFAPGDTSKSFAVLINEDSYVEGSETFNVNLSNPSGASLGASVATVTINDDPTEPSTNVIDDPRDYVCQHYHDFLNRQPDQSGWDFWTNEITSCGTNQSCIELKRINVSAAFYISIEFQQTGYLVERMYKAAYGNANGTSTFGDTHQLPVPIVRLNEFLPDTQQIGQGVIVNQAGWEQVLENNKQAFTAEFAQRLRFTTAFPPSLTAAQFVDTLNANAGNPLSSAERDQLVNDLSTSAKTRAQVLRAVAEDSDLNSAEFNRAFVLMQYFGYLRRNPNDPQDTDYSGFDFWLTKLNQFNGNYISAEMVKAFISSSEYRQRFGP
jgi:uncharacterized delta-60 repeat protein